MGKAWNSIVFLVVASLTLSLTLAAGSHASPPSPPPQGDGDDLRAALKTRKSFPVVAPLLAKTIQQAGHLCPTVGSYQIYRVTSEDFTIKTRCEGVPTYVVRINKLHGSHVVGGDGTIQPMDPDDGAIVVPPVAKTADGAAASSGPARPPAAMQQHSVSSAPVMTTGSGGVWQAFFGGMLTMVALGGGLALHRYRQEAAKAPRFTSDEKNLLLQESEEILPAIYYHPEGWFIAKGRHGKRRIFRTLFFAYLYRSYGLKFGEAG